MKGPIDTKKAFLSFFIILFVFSTASIFGQDKEKNDLKKKLSELKGKVEKITVKVDGKEVVFEGKDAENLVKKMKSPATGAFSYSYGKGKGKGRSYAIISDNLDELKECDTEDEGVFVSVSGDEGHDKEMKKIKVKKEDGKITVTIITTDKEGKKIEKVLEGDDAEKYLEENNDGVSVSTPGVYMMHSKIPAKVKFLKVKPAKTIIIEKEDSDDDDDAAVVIEKADKVKKDVVIKKKKTETNKEEKEK